MVVTGCYNKHYSEIYSFVIAFTFLAFMTVNFLASMIPIYMFKPQVGIKQYVIQ